MKNAIKNQLDSNRVAFTKSKRLAQCYTASVKKGGWKTNVPDASYITSYDLLQLKTDLKSLPYNFHKHCSWDKFPDTHSEFLSLSMSVMGKCPSEKKINHQSSLPRIIDDKAEISTKLPFGAMATRTTKSLMLQFTLQSGFFGVEISLSSI